VRRDHLVDAIEPDLDGLLDDAVLACPGGRERGLVMQTARRRDGNDVDVVAGDEDLEVISMIPVSTAPGSPLMASRCIGVIMPLPTIPNR
jgi:hypothetical protein